MQNMKAESPTESARLATPDHFEHTALTLPFKDWNEPIGMESKAAAVTALEAGKIVYLPELRFHLEAEESNFFGDASPWQLSAKSVKYSSAQKKVWGVTDEQKSSALAAMLDRYARLTSSLLANLFPEYKLKLGNTSFRPAKIEGRQQSKRHDDTRMHVDAFPSRPTQSDRILRVFNNGHPGDCPRVWQVGEGFPEVAGKFLPVIPKPLPGLAPVLQLLRITKSRRTPYDHYMLQIHDRMKLSDEYQANVKKDTMGFPSGATWIAFTDQVSHAAISGQYLFEQTFTLPIRYMAQPEQSPFRVIERQLQNR
jgi:hypothetical protein